MIHGLGNGNNCYQEKSTFVNFIPENCPVSNSLLGKQSLRETPPGKLSPTWFQKREHKQ